MKAFRSILLASVLLIACDRVSDVSEFVKAGDIPGEEYSFLVDMSDSTASYDLSFYSRAVEESLASLPLRVTWVSPSGEAAAETVYMAEVSREGSEESYRSGVVPSEYGEWTLRIRPLARKESIYGFGLTYRKVNGTR